MSFQTISICVRKICVENANNIFYLSFFRSFSLFLMVTVVKQVDGELLILNQVQRSDMGSYSCIASNGVPPSVSKRYNVQVNCKYSCLCLCVSIYRNMFSLRALFRSIYSRFSFRQHQNEQQEKMNAWNPQTKKKTYFSTAQNP